MSTDSAGVKRNRRHTWQILLIGFALIGSVFVAQGVITRYLTEATEQRSRRLERDARRRVDEANRIARDAMQIELRVNDHIYETSPAKMAIIEKNIDALLSDIDTASRAYEPLIALPEEASQWAKAHASLDRFRANVAVALQLSRLNLDVEARERWQASQASYSDLDPTLLTLIALNQEASRAAAAEIDVTQERTQKVNDAVRLFGLIGVVLLAQWVIRRVLAYERQIESSAELLALQNHELDAFAGRVAHDLKNALGPLLIFPALLRRDAADPHRVREIAQSTERSMRRTSQVIDSLLAFARASFEIDPEAAADVRSAVESVLEETAHLASHLGATIEVAAVPDLVVRCEPGLLHAVLANLVGNAVKYLAGRPVRRVQIRVSRDDETCRFEIADTGPGIPKSRLQAIFEPFYRVDTNLGAGSGIGLATVRRILDARGGRIEVDSEEGQGARFVVWLPLGASDRVVGDRPPDDATWPYPPDHRGERHVH